MDGSGLRITEIVLVGRSVAAFLFKQTVTSITFTTATHGSNLKQSLLEALAYEQDKKGALRVTDVPPPPKPLTATQIRAIRQSFKVSQAVFARIINVSPNAVESWEQGVRRPREATLKLLTIAHKHPEILLSGE